MQVVNKCFFPCASWCKFYEWEKKTATQHATRQNEQRWEEIEFHSQRLVVLLTYLQTHSIFHAKLTPGWQRCMLAMWKYHWACFNFAVDFSLTLSTNIPLIDITMACARLNLLLLLFHLKNFNYTMQMWNAMNSCVIKICIVLCIFASESRQEFCPFLLGFCVSIQRFVFFKYIFIIKWHICASNAA